MTMTLKAYVRDINLNMLTDGDFDHGWDFDHIIPVSSGITKEMIYELNHYTNFQPLCSKINRDIKRDKMDFIIE